MSSSDKIYILENLYSNLGISLDQIILDSNNMLSVENKISRVRYLDKENNDCWIPLDNGGDPEILDKISKPLTIYTRPDLRSTQTTYEKNFLTKFIYNTDIHCHFEKPEFVEKFTTYNLITKNVSKLLSIDKNDICWVLFKWTNPIMCNWHMDGQTTFKVSNIKNPSNITINLSLTDNSYLELKTSNNNIISNKNYANEVFMFDHTQRIHRIILNNKYRLGLAVRARNVIFYDVVQKFQNLKLIKDIIE